MLSLCRQLKANSLITNGSVKNVNFYPMKMRKKIYIE